MDRRRRKVVARGHGPTVPAKKNQVFGRVRDRLLRPASLDKFVQPMDPRRGKAVSPLSEVQDIQS